MALPQLFGILPTGLSPIVVPTSAPSQTSFIFNLPARPYSHIAVFLLPGITLPPSSAAAVYLQLPNKEFRFLGAIGEGKESAIYKISGLLSPEADGGGGMGGEVDMDADAPSPAQEITLGISLEAAAAVATQLSALEASRSSTLNTQPQDASQALVLSRPPPADQEVKVQLAQKIIKNAFNFLASYSGNLQNGVEVVPLKAFEGWWKKFEGRVRSDPGFLERDDE